MKNKLHIACAGLLLLGLAACSGNDDNGGNGDNGGDKPIEGPYTLSVENNEIEANGEDAAKLILTDKNGNVLTETNQLNYISFENTETGDVLSRTNIFTSIKNGSFTFRANYKTSKSENTVTITAKNRLAYEKYFRKVVVHDLTDVMCVACPSMTTALENVADIWKKQLLVLAVHGGFSNVDPWTIGNMSSSMMRAFGGQGWPTAIFNLDYLMANNERNPAAINKIVESQLRKYPATCGIRVSSTLTAEGDVVIEAGLTSSTGGDYDLGYALVMDGLTYQGGYTPNNDGIYDDVVIGITSNYMTFSKAQGFNVPADQEHTENWTFDKSEGHMCVGIDNSNKAKCRVVVFALRPNGNKTLIDNIVECPLGETMDYVINE